MKPNFWRLFAPVILFSGLGLVTAADVPFVMGVTEPFHDVTLSAPAAGTIKRRGFEEGDFVKAGQLILQLDNELEELNVRRRRLVRDTLKSESESIRLLFNTTKSESKETLEKKELEYNVAVVDYELAVEQLKRRQVVAPIDGYLVEHFLEVGEDCEPQKPLVRLVETRQCYLVCHLDPRSAVNLKSDRQVPLAIEAGTELVEVSGTVSFVAPVVDPASGLLKVKIRFDNPDQRIRPGMAGRLKLTNMPQ